MEYQQRTTISPGWKRFAVVCFIVWNEHKQLRLSVSLLSEDTRTQTEWEQTPTTLAYNKNKNNNNNNNLYQALDEWRRVRTPRVERFIDGKPKAPLPDHAEDTIGGGPILDFLITGFPKCGTTGMMRTLQSVTAMPNNEDVCVPIKQTVYKTYVDWPRNFGGKAGPVGPFEYSEEKPLRGSKCPNWLERVDYLDEIGRTIPKTPLIVGIRHPVLFFQSFANQMWSSKKKWRPRMTIMDFLADKRLRSGDEDTYFCPGQNMACVARSRFHLSLARLGKTPLQQEERDLLAEELYQARRRRNDPTDKLVQFAIPDSITSGDSFGVPNRVFLFESNQGREEYLYRELAEFVRIDRDRLPPVEDTYKSRWSGNATANHRKSKKGDFSIDICLPEFDPFRKELMPIAHTLGRWLLDYFIPASLTRDDITIPNVTAFREIVEGYTRDPCDDALVRNATDGEYYHRVPEQQQVRAE